MEKPDVIICQWTLCLYDDKTRKWIYGVLDLKPDQVEFLPNSQKGVASTVIVIPFEDWINIKKATTGLVFGAVYIVTKGNHKLWFSSIQDRDGFYGTLRHFWISQLFNKKEQKASTAGAGKATQLGQKLVGIVQDSQDTLSKAAVQLNDQGRQIDSSLWTMSDLHNDLDVAENLVKTLETWTGRWRLPKQYNMVDPVVVNKCDIPEVFEIEVIYNKVETGKANPRVIGLLRLCSEGLFIMSLKQALVHHYKWSDVSKIRVVTPYETMIVQYHLGKADLVYSVVCANMMAILRIIEKCAKYKLEYDKPPDTVVCTSHQVRVRREAEQKDTGKTIKEPLQVNAPDSQAGSYQFNDAPQLQISQQAQVVSEREVDQICEGLTSLKSLALAVQEEEGVQNEKLDSLRTSVDRANDRLTAINRRVQKMT